MYVTVKLDAMSTTLPYPQTCWTLYRTEDLPTITGDLFPEILWPPLQNSGKGDLSPEIRWPPSQNSGKNDSLAFNMDIFNRQVFYRYGFYRFS